MIRTKEEILTAINGRIGEDTSDEALALIEDVSDTLTDLETKAGNPEDYEARLKELDRSWRERYKARFFGSGSDPDPEEEQGADESEAPQRFEDLFS